MFLDRFLLMSQPEWGELFSNRKFNIAAYICIFIGFVLCIINDGPDLATGELSLKSVYAIIILSVLTNLAIGIYRKRFYAIPIAVLCLDLVFILTILYHTFILNKSINAITVCYSVMYFIINAIIFNLKSVLILNFGVFVAVALCAARTVSAEDAASSASPSLILNALILSAAGFLLQHLVLSVRAMLIEKLGAVTLQMAALKAEMEIEKAKKEAREKTIQLNRISIVEALGASIAHEVNQPIAAALTYCQAVRNWSAVEYQNAPETLCALAGVESNVARAARLIENIRLLTTQKDRKYAMADVREVVSDQVDLIQSEFERRHIRLRLEPSTGETTALVCASEIALATINLLRNAMEAFDASVQDALVSVHCRRSGTDWIEIHVVDNGRGLSPEEVQTAFGAFQTSKETGVGIGLSICQEVAEHHSGSMSLTANSNGGVTATLRIAIAPAKA